MATAPETACAPSGGPPAPGPPRAVPPRAPQAPLQFTFAAYASPQTDPNVLAASRVPALVRNIGSNGNSNSSNNSNNSNSSSVDCAALLATVPVWDPSRRPPSPPARMCACGCSDRVVRALAAALGPDVWGPRDLAGATVAAPVARVGAGTQLEAFWAAFGVARPAVMADDPAGANAPFTSAALTPYYATELVFLLSGL